MSFNDINKFCENVSKKSHGLLNVVKVNSRLLGKYAESCMIHHFWAIFESQHSRKAEYKLADFLDFVSEIMIKLFSLLSYLALTFLEKMLQ